MGRGVEGAQAVRVTAAHLAQHLHPLTGLHAVPRLHVQWLLTVEHLEHLKRGEERVVVNNTQTNYLTGCIYGANELPFADNYDFLLSNRHS